LSPIIDIHTAPTSTDETISISVRRDEHAAILAGLRVYQLHTHPQVDSIQSEIATDGGAFAAIESDQIDELAERLNCGSQNADQSTPGSTR